MAIRPHCVVCGFDTDAAGAVEFADYAADWREPVGPEGDPIAGWSNELGVTAPPGVGLFCARHLRRAQKLRRLSASEALRQLSAEGPARGWLWR